MVQFRREKALKSLHTRSYSQAHIIAEECKTQLSIIEQSNGLGIDHHQLQRAEIEKYDYLKHWSRHEDNIPIHKARINGCLRVKLPLNFSFAAIKVRKARNRISIIHNE